MKKIVSMLLVAVMCCGLLVGCGDKKREDLAEDQAKVVDVNKLPHNQEIKLTDTKENVIAKDKLEENVTEMTVFGKREEVRIAGVSATVGYDFNNDDEIAVVLYDVKNTDSNRNAIQEFIDKNYGNLNSDEVTKRKIISVDGKAWIIGYFEVDQNTLRVAISRQTELDSNMDSTKGNLGSESKNDVLPHNANIHLSDTKSDIENIETLSDSEYGIAGLYDSSSTWRVENSDFEISYSFSDDGSIQYVTYMLVNSSLSEIELGFIEVTANYELEKLYGDGDGNGNWIINSEGNTFNVTLEVDEGNSSILIKIMPA